MPEVLLRVPAATRGERDIIFGWRVDPDDDDTDYLFIGYANSPGYDHYPLINVWREHVARCVPFLTNLYLGACKGYPVETKRPCIIRDSGKRELFRIRLVKDAIIFQDGTHKFRADVAQLPFILKFFEVIAQND